MTLAHGRPYRAIPGPSVMPDAVLRAMHRAAPNIYTGELHDLTASLIPDLKRVARTEHQVAMYIANGHGVWEAALANVLSRGDRVLCLATGRFGIGWSEMAQRLGADVELMDCGQTQDIDFEMLEKRLAADTGHAIKAVTSVFVDTSTGIKNDTARIRAVLDATGHPALLMSDCIASMGCDRFEMDAWGVDVAITASQKGLMTPPGMGFVFFNDRADARREAADCVTHYWDWRSRATPDIYYQHFDGTAPTHHLYGLRAALDMIFDEGLEAVWARHETLARAIWAAVETWGAAEASPIRLNVADPAQRSHAVTSVHLGAPAGAALQRWCEDRAGVTLGIGLGREPTEAWFRIGHMGHVNAHMVLGVLGVIEAGLHALNVPFAPGGVSAAAEIVSTA